eukprot:1610240-Rhodomonas_salina.1
MPGTDITAGTVLDVSMVDTAGYEAVQGESNGHEVPKRSAHALCDARVCHEQVRRTYGTAVCYGTGYTIDIGSTSLYHIRRRGTSAAADTAPGKAHAKTHTDVYICTEKHDSSNNNATNKHKQIHDKLPCHPAHTPAIQTAVTNSRGVARTGHAASILDVDAVHGRRLGGGGLCCCGGHRLVRS